MRRLSTEQILMLLVAGIGGYAVYRMTKASPSSPDDKVDTPFSNPDLAGLDVPATLDVVTDGDHLRISANRFYRARFETTESPDQVARRLASLGVGLSGTFYVAPQEALAAGFPAWSLTPFTPNTLWFAGVSTGAGKPPRPPGLTIMWTALPP